MIDAIEYKGFKVEIHQDGDASNPITEFDGNCQYALFHKRFDLPNTQDLDHEVYEGWDEMKEDIMQTFKVRAIKPLYMYDHSRITISTKPFGNRWDSFQIGFVWIDTETLKEWGHTEPDKIEDSKINEWLEGNVALYRDYLEGNVYGYEIDDNGLSDSCWGYYGDAGKKEMIEQVKGIIDNYITENPVYQNWEEMTREKIVECVDLVKRLAQYTHWDDKVTEDYEKDGGLEGTGQTAEEYADQAQTDLDWLTHSDNDLNDLIVQARTILTNENQTTDESNSN